MHHLYSQAIVAFLDRTLSLSRQILRDEMKIKVGKTRFIIGNTYYPLHFVIFEGKNTLGYFQADLFEIGLNKCFVYDQKHLIDTLRHELAHYYCWIKYRDLTHSVLYRQTCQTFGWPAHVSKARLTQETTTPPAIASRIHKLLALSNSTNPHEAQAALLKARTLLKKHPLDPEPDRIVKRVLSGKRSTPKWHTIASILKTFGVYPIFNKGHNTAYLEIFGSKENVLTADYVTAFLNQELEILWKAQKHLKGATARHSFFDGIAKGYLAEISDNEEGLIPLENQLSLAYPHLRMAKSERKHNAKAHQEGKKWGKKLKIRSPIESPSFLGLPN